MIAIAVTADPIMPGGLLRSLSWIVSWIASVVVIALGLAIAGPSANAAEKLAAEKFQRLTGAQITARFSGLEMSDDVHWRDRYERNGTIASVSMGKSRFGKWRVEQNELCVDFGKDEGGCYQVWLSGSKAEFRREGFDGSILGGTLQTPAKGR